MRKLTPPNCVITIRSGLKLALIRRKFTATGGAELYLQRLLRALAEGGHDVHLFTESWREKPEGVTLHPVAVSGSRGELPLNFAEAVRLAVEAEPFNCVFSLERTIRQDVYRAGDGLHCVWQKRRGEFAPWWKKPFLSRGAFHRNMRALEAQTFDPANTGHVIVNSAMVQREILEHFNFPNERIHLIRNGVETARFQRGNRGETRARFGVKEDEFLMLFTGSGWERKGLGYLIAALREMDGSKLKLLVVGKGRKPCCIPGNIIFAGPMSDVENAYAAADLFTFLPVYEPSANVCFEALAAGLPVVTTAQNGASEVITEGVNGSVVDRPDDKAAVVKAIRFWHGKQDRRPVKTAFDLSLERNVMETLAVLELAALEKRR
jgi:UDP-glucose:(heptosyl)LPS alpha-1,3-glucosyltransferase